MTTTLDLDGSGLLAIFLLALTCNVAFALHDSFFKKPSPEEVAMAVNIASLTVKAAEVRVRLVVPLRVASAVVACAASPANVALGVGQRRWLVWQARKDALSGRRRRRQTFLEWSQTAHTHRCTVHTVHTSVCSSMSLHTYAGVCLAPCPQLDTKDTFISWSRVRRELVLLEKKLADAGTTLRCPFTHSPAPHLALFSLGSFS